jgi:hypothetical protein
MAHFDGTRANKFLRPPAAAETYASQFNFTSDEAA